jgi:hypothetical protein
MRTYMRDGGTDARLLSFSSAITRFSSLTLLQIFDELYLIQFFINRSGISPCEFRTSPRRSGNDANNRRYCATKSDGTEQGHLVAIY